MRATPSKTKETPHKNAYRAAIASARPALSSVILFSAILNVLMLTGSLYMLQVYDRVLPGGSVPTLVVLFGIVLVLFAFLGFYDFLRARLLSRVALRMDDILSGPAFRKWLDAGLPNAHNPADAQVMRDLDTLRNFLSGPAVSAMADVLFVPMFLVILFLIHPWLGALTIAGAALGAIIALINRAVTRDAINKTLTFDTTERNFTALSQRNVEAIQAMGMHAAVASHWRRMHRSTLAVTQKGSDPSEILAASSRAFRMLLQSSILTLGALLVLRGEISAGMIIASSILSGRALAPVDQLIGQWRATGTFAAAHKRMMVAFENDASDRAHTNLPDPTGQITVTGLTKLGPKQKNGEHLPILSEVGFELVPGDALGVIGSSASGKSTLARLLVGAGKSDAGDIRLDGATPDQWDPEQLGRNVGYLPQMVDMLPGTIQENISRFQEGAFDDAVIEAARLTGIHEMILKLPDGYQTRLGDPQTPPMLSGGQLQRMGLARAIYGLPKLVVLDEPNANLDIAGDAALAEVITHLRAAGSTVIVMAHRPNVLDVVNKLMILQHGKVGAFGDRDALLAEGISAGQRPALAPQAKPKIGGAKQAATLAEPSAQGPVQAPAQAMPKTRRSASKPHISAKATQTRAKPSVVRMAGPTNRKRQA